MLIKHLPRAQQALHAQQAVHDLSLSFPLSLLVISWPEIDSTDTGRVLRTGQGLHLTYIIPLFKGPVTELF